MRIPKRVNTVLDWMELHYLALGVVGALVVVALVATLAPSSVGIPVGCFILGLAAGGFFVHVRSSRRVSRARTEVDGLLRENGALRHRNTILASGVITRESQETQALVAIPEDDLLGLAQGGETTRTVTLDELLGGDPQVTDELPDEIAAAADGGGSDEDEDGADEPGGGPAQSASATGDEATGDEASGDEAASDPAKGDAAGSGPGDVRRDGDPTRTTILTELPDGLFDKGTGRTAKKKSRRA